MTKKLTESLRNELYWIANIGADVIMYRHKKPVDEHDMIISLEYFERDYKEMMQCLQN